MCFLDRFFDLHVMTPVQHAVGAALTGDPVKRQDGLALATAKLELAYAWLEGHPADRTWAAGREFTMADCAASPALRAYRTRLLASPSFARAVEEARYFRPNFSLGAPNRD